MHFFILIGKTARSKALQYLSKAHQSAEAHRLMAIELIQLIFLAAVKTHQKLSSVMKKMNSFKELTSTRQNIRL